MPSASTRTRVIACVSVEDGRTARPGSARRAARASRARSGAVASAIRRSHSASAARPCTTACRPRPSTVASRTVGTTPARTPSAVTPATTQPATAATSSTPASRPRRRAAAPRRAVAAAWAACSCAARRAASAPILSWVPCGRSTWVPPLSVSTTRAPRPGVRSPTRLSTGPQSGRTLRATSARLRRDDPSGPVTASTRSASENRSSVRDSSNCCRCRSLCGTRYAIHRPTTTRVAGPANSYTPRR
jgi:hypothetical protein